MDIVFWQNALSIHQAPFIRALSAREDTSVHVIAFDGVSTRRRAMGWHAPDFGEARVIVVGGADDLAVVYSSVRGVPFHIFSGFGAYSGVRGAVKEMAKVPGLRRFVMTEPWDVRGPLGTIRGLVSAVRVRKLAPLLAGVLACGSLARSQLRRMRAMENVPVYDFGYFVDRTSTSVQATRVVQAPWRLIFVGDLAEWKNPLGLLSALSELLDEDWTLTMVGEGPQGGAVHEAIAHHGLGGRVTVQPRAGNADIRMLIAQSDLLVLPSTYDGWGAVINEALMDGTMVVVSDAAGASDLVVHDSLGVRFDPGSQKGLENALRESFGLDRSDSSRRARADWAASAISPVAAAAYFVQVLNTHPGAVSAPWKA